VFITGFAIQQTLQILDPAVMGGIYAYKKRRVANGKPELPGNMAEGDFKKAVMALLSFLGGLVTVLLTGIKLLFYAREEWGGGPADVFITALVVGSGTEAVNTILKFLGYVKEAQKPAPDVEVSLNNASPTVARGSTFQFRAVVKNSENKVVEWKVLHGNGGSITLDGLYTAPGAAGIYQVTAISSADPTKAAIATVTVT
jgi:hypothetical protein